MHFLTLRVGAGRGIRPRLSVGRYFNSRGDRHAAVDALHILVSAVVDAPIDPSRLQGGTLQLVFFAVEHGGDFLTRDRALRIDGLDDRPDAVRNRLVSDDLAFDRWKRAGRVE